MVTEKAAADVTKRRWWDTLEAGTVGALVTLLASHFLTKQVDEFLAPPGWTVVAGLFDEKLASQLFGSADVVLEIFQGVSPEDWKEFPPVLAVIAAVGAKVPARVAS